MAGQHWTYVNCGDWRHKNRVLRLGRIRRGITIAAPAADVTVWSLEQAERLHVELGTLIEGLRGEVETVAHQL